MKHTLTTDNILAAIYGDAIFGGGGNKSRQQSDTSN